MTHSKLIARIGMLLIAIAVFLIGTWSNVVADGPTIEGSALYGIQPYEPILLDDAIRISLPGGASVRQKDNHAAYHAIDHLGSDRVASHQIGHNEYGPMGGVANGTAPRYAGKSWDVATRTYDFLARQYDPTTGRFLSRDPDRTSAGPYAYVNGNPINFVDPDGRAPVHFFFYSKYGTEVPDFTGFTSVKENLEALHVISKKLPILVVTAVLENNIPVPVPTGRIQGSHMTIVSHGDPGVFAAVDPHTDETIDITGDEFPEFLHSSMVRAFGEHADRIAAGTRSMSILSCQGACRGRSTDGQLEPSFAEVFASVARSYFPNLEDVVASPYDVYTGPGVHESHQHEFDLGLMHAPHGEYETLSRHMSMENFFIGRYPDDLFGPVSQVNFGALDKVWRLPWSTDRVKQYRGVTDDRGAIRDYVRLYGRKFSEPVLRRIPISSQPVLPPPDLPAPALPGE